MSLRLELVAGHPLDFAPALSRQQQQPKGAFKARPLRWPTRTIGSRRRSRPARVLAPEWWPMPVTGLGEPSITARAMSQLKNFRTSASTRLAVIGDPRSVIVSRRSMMSRRETAPTFRSDHRERISRLISRSISAAVDAFRFALTRRLRNWSSRGPTVSLRSAAPARDVLFPQLPDLVAQKQFERPQLPSCVHQQGRNVGSALKPKLLRLPVEAIYSDMPIPVIQRAAQRGRDPASLRQEPRAASR